MTEKWIPTDEELDALLDAQPQFDPEAVKARTLAAVAGQEPPEKSDGAMGEMMARPDQMPQGEINGEASEVFSIMAGGDYFTVV